LKKVSKVSSFVDSVGLDAPSTIKGGATLYPV